MLSGFRNFALTFTISLVIFGIIAYFTIGFITGMINETVPVDGVPDTDYHIVAPPPETEDDESTADTEKFEEIEGDSFNMLLIGSDYQPELFDDYDYEEKWTGSGFPDKRNRKWGADSLILLRVDKENRQFIFCPIPSNTRVTVDGNNTQLGNLIATKNVDYLCGKVMGLTGLRIDYYAHITVGSIAAIVDAVGGITYYVPEDMQYDDPVQDLHINLIAGTHNITGSKAAQLLRYVGYENGNVGRMNTAVEFLKAVFAKFTGAAYLDKAINLYNAIKNNVQTNFTADDLANNLELIFSYSDFESVTVTYPGSTKTIDGVAYFEPSLTSAMEMFDSFIE